MARTMHAIRGPSLAAGLWRNCPKDGPHDVGQFDPSPRMDCRRTPAPVRAPGAQGLCGRRECGVAFSLLRAPALRPAGQLRCSRRSCGAVVTFSWPRKRKRLARPEASEKRQGCCATKARKENGTATEVAPTKTWGEKRFGCLVPMERKARDHWMKPASTRHQNPIKPINHSVVSFSSE